MKAVVSSLNSFNIKSVKGILLGTLVGVLMLIIMLLVVSFVILQTGNFPVDLITYISLALLAVASYFSGYTAGRINKASGLVYGIITGVVLFTIIFIAGIISNSSNLSLISLYKLIVTIIFSSIGGIMAVNKKEKIHIK